MSPTRQPSIAEWLESTALPEQIPEVELRALDIRNGAMFANLAYSDNPNLDAGQGWTLLSRTQLGLTQAQWDNDASDSTNSQLVFDIDNGQAIVARNGDQLSIAFRGSEPGDGAIDFFDDLVGGLASFAPHFNLFADLVARVDAYVASEGITDVLVAGHSLGGAMVEMFMAQHPDGTSVSYSGVSFGSPGEPFSINSPGSDLRLLNIGHSGDPVFRSATFHAVGVDTDVSLPANVDYSLAGLILRAVQTRQRCG